MDIEKLNSEIAAYQAQLPAIRKEFGSAWILMAGQKVVRAFSEFGDAARYAVANYGAEQVLIRHTDERLETAPYVQVRA